MGVNELARGQEWTQTTQPVKLPLPKARCRGHVAGGRELKGKPGDMGPAGWDAVGMLGVRMAHVSTGCGHRRSLPAGSDVGDVPLPPRHVPADSSPAASCWLVLSGCW